MADERDRTRAGFSGLGTAQTFAHTGPTAPPSIPAHISDISDPAMGQFTNRLPGSSQSSNTTPVPSSIFSAADIGLLRARLPNLQGISDNFLMHMAQSNIAALIQLDGSSTGATSSAPVHTAKPPDTETRMARALDELRANPTQLASGADDRVETLHAGRFLGGAVCNLKQLWLKARDTIGLDGILPLASYDLDSVGLGGCITTRGWTEIHNPASNCLFLKFFSSTNVGASSQSTRRLTLADGDGAIDVSDSLKNISDLEDYKTALRAVSKAMHLALPWNHSVSALEGYMHTSNFCAKDLAGRANRAALLTDFTDYVFSTNAKRWVNKMEFIGATEMRNCFEQWFGSRSASVLAPANNTSNEQNSDASRTDQRVNDKRGGSYQRGRGGHFFHNNTGNFNNKKPNNSQGDVLCRRFNAGACPNSHKDCATSNGQKLLHLCSHKDKNGHACKKTHPECRHR
jgi:hypothetical protein